ncbi:hypothetical protein NXH67_16015 [Butyrivibrio sp. DSM 10294]|uniref:NifB/NifX family molybdenum-iron cluster-binding protein n=1 Tax=Butyrivibrio sp. DSM 10294 TaxID=2972457 RepID=UPI00234F3D88|nr:NifB/NifX family molybdenum-iron cluster-binding protein [Butyrivibrio sp. DSM 10294]MDC7295018.1 hypothetical protein [Butyrivibrio sp. DSM 10294]
MSYLIAVASSDGSNVDLTFGEAEFFRIYEVEGTEYHEKEVRQVPAAEESDAAADQSSGEGKGCDSAGAGGCGNGSGSGCGNGNGGGCGGPRGHSVKVELIADCRSIVCKKIGFQATKQLEKKAIAGFDVSCGVDEALTKISAYYNKIDNHQSLRRE